MKVYGDERVEDDPGGRIAHLRAGLAAAGRAPALEPVRARLIEAGMLEQAAWDAPPWDPPVAGAALAAIRSATLAAAGALVALARGGRADAAARWLARGDQALASLPPPAPGRTVPVRLPEGYAFYGLFPEQYIAAAQQWLGQQGAAGPGTVLVVGIRSIGTSLSAVVHATLAARGVAVRSLTVRPTGPPFERTLDLDPAIARGVAGALVVDEGPGLSGSSMAAVAEALARASCPRVVFLPGHEHGPGRAASPAVLACWARTPSCVVPLERVRLAGRTLAQALASGIGAQVSARAPALDVGGGRWRALHFPDPADWPAVCGRFEHPKRLLRTRDNRQLLFRFAGLIDLAGDSPAPLEAARLAARARGGAVVAPLGHAHGHVASEWLDARPLGPADGTPAVLAAVGAHVARCARFETDARTFTAAAERLRDMMATNAREALGPAAAGAAARLGPGPTEAPPAHAAGDGRLAPHEWLRTGDGRLLKADAGGHDSDHTLAGVQPVAWDLAGALLEWDLDGEAARPLLEGFRSAGGAMPGPGALAFHCAAYSALRAGQFALCAGAEGEPAEAERLGRAARGWRDRLARCLAGSAVIAR